MVAGGVGDGLAAQVERDVLACRDGDVLGHVGEQLDGLASLCRVDCGLERCVVGLANPGHGGRDVEATDVAAGVVALELDHEGGGAGLDVVAPLDRVVGALDEGGLAGLDGELGLDRGAGVGLVGNLVDRDAGLVLEDLELRGSGAGVVSVFLGGDGHRGGAGIGVLLVGHLVLGCRNVRAVDLDGDGGLLCGPVVGHAGDGVDVCHGEVSLGDGPGDGLGAGGAIGPDAALVERGGRGVVAGVGAGVASDGVAIACGNASLGGAVVRELRGLRDLDHVVVGQTIQTIVTLGEVLVLGDVDLIARIIGEGAAGDVDAVRVAHEGDGRGLGGEGAAADGDRGALVQAGVGRLGVEDDGGAGHHDAGVADPAGRAAGGVELAAGDGDLAGARDDACAVRDVEGAAGDVDHVVVGDVDAAGDVALGDDAAVEGAGVHGELVAAAAGRAIGADDGVVDGREGAAVDGSGAGVNEQQRHLLGLDVAGLKRELAAGDADAAVVGGLDGAALDDGLATDVQGVVAGGVGDGLAAQVERDVLACRDGDVLGHVGEQLDGLASLRRVDRGLERCVVGFAHLCDVVLPACREGDVTRERRGEVVRRGCVGSKPTKEGVRALGGSRGLGRQGVDLHDLVLNLSATSLVERHVEEDVLEPVHAVGINDKALSNGLGDGRDAVQGVVGPSSAGNGHVDARLGVTVVVVRAITVRRVVVRTTRYLERGGAGVDAVGTVVTKHGRIAVGREGAARDDGVAHGEDIGLAAIDERSA